jgi:hypothetical protein
VVVADVTDAAFAAGADTDDAVAGGGGTVVADALAAAVAAALFPDLLTRIVTGSPLGLPLARSFWHLTADISLYYLPPKETRTGFL